MKIPDKSNRFFYWRADGIFVIAFFTAFLFFFGFSFLFIGSLILSRPGNQSIEAAFAIIICSIISFLLTQSLLCLGRKLQGKTDLDLGQVPVSGVATYYLLLLLSWILKPIFKKDVIFGKSRTPQNSSHAEVIQQFEKYKKRHNKSRFKKPEEENNAWIQRADFSTHDIVDSNPTNAIKAFYEFDWANELRAQEEIKSKGEEECNSGFGLGTFGDECFIHIIPKTTDRAEVLYVDKNNEQTLKENFPFENVKDLINAYFDKDIQKIKELLNA